MKITDKMLHAAVKRSSELGIIPKVSDLESYVKTWEAIKEILEAALEAEP